MSHAEEIPDGERFEFEANWSRFLEHLNVGRIAQARESLSNLDKRARDMSVVHDWEDSRDRYPFEIARPGTTFELEWVEACAGTLGRNEAISLRTLASKK